MMGTRTKMNAQEFDAFTGWRKLMNWRPGQLRKIKSQFWRKRRRTMKREDRLGQS